MEEISRRLFLAWSTMSATAALAAPRKKRGTPWVRSEPWVRSQVWVR